MRDKQKKKTHNSKIVGHLNKTTLGLFEAAVYNNTPCFKKLTVFVEYISVVE